MDWQGACPCEQRRQSQVGVTLPGADEITAGFTADQVAGGAGCNSYSASYQVEGDVMTVGPVIATLMACAEPDGIMMQERDLMAALEATPAYQVDGGTLTLMDANGARVATFTQAKG